MINNSTSNRPSFTSRITFVSPETYQRVIKDIPQKFNIINWTRKGMIEGQDVFTKAVRSCSAGGVVDGEQATSFFHLQDMKEVLGDLPFIRKKLDTQGSGALLVGQKDMFDIRPKWNKTLRRSVPERTARTESEDLFCRLKAFLEDKLPLSYFHGHNEEWESSLCYKGGGHDTWYICTQRIDHPEDYVRDLPDLRRIFKDWNISSVDTLDFEG